MDTTLSVKSIGNGAKTKSFHSTPLEEKWGEHGSSLKE
jgi:hypothetical protein